MAIFVIFVIAVALLGGSSRPDAVQLLLLRPLSALFFVYVLFQLTLAKCKPLMMPISLLAALFLIMTIQLAPLPPEIWMALPGRQEVADLGAAVGMTDIWRPLSLSPSRTANALAGLLIPITSLLFFVALEHKHKQIVFLILGIFAFLGALLGIIQLLVPGNKILFFYDVTNMGSAVGFFANRNHNAVFLVVGLFALLHHQWLRRERGAKLQLADTIIVAAALFVLFLILLNGSRAGLICLGIFIFSAALMFLLSARSELAESKEKSGWKNLASRFFLPGALLLLFGTVVGLFLVFDRIPAVNRLLANDVFSGLRYEAFGTFVSMVEIFWLSGSGFGSFEYVYRIHEPSSLLMPNYVNQAHNDWLQIVIEGGVPALFVLGIFVIWLLRRCIGLMRRPSVNWQQLIFWVGLFSVIATASLFDYPLRTPIFQMAGVWIVALFATQSRISD